jgi:hypothetical protein
VGRDEAARLHGFDRSLGPGHAAQEEQDLRHRNGALRRASSVTRVHRRTDAGGHASGGGRGSPPQNNRLAATVGGVTPRR